MLAVKKRKVGNGPTLRGRVAKATAAHKRKKTFRKGYDRTGGYYGRYKGPVSEMKFHDLDIDDASIALGGTIIADSCNLIAQGVTESQRVGRKCTIMGINWRYNVTLSAATNQNNSSEIVRLVLYQDKQCNGAAATVTGLVETSDYQSFNNLANKNRFNILMDRTYQLNATAGSGRGATDTLSYGEHTVQDSFYKKCTIPIEYDSTTGAITEIRSNNIGVMIFGATGGISSFGSKMRLRFTDQ